MRVADHFRLSVDSVRLTAGGSALDDPNLLIWELGTPINCTVSRRKIKFMNVSERFVIDLACELTVHEVKGILQREHAVPPGFELLAGGTAVDDEMTMQDLDDVNEFVVQGTERLRSSLVLGAQAPPTPFQMTVIMGVIPRPTTIRLLPSVTLHEAEVEIRKKFDLGAVGLEFALSDIDTDETACVPRNSVIGSLDLKHFQLLVQPEGTVDAAADEEAHDIALEAMHITCGSQRPSQISIGRVRYRFAVAQKNEEFLWPFAGGQTVLDAKKMICARYSLGSTADVTLLLSGKALRDGFVLERLRIGNGSITVYIRDFSEVFVQTATANRQDSGD